MSSLKSLVQRHPLVSAWIVLAIGMVAMLIYSAKDVGLLPTQMAALVVATVALAGLCVWIVSWE